MNSKKRPSTLSDRSISRCIAKKKAKIYEEIEKKYAEVIDSANPDIASCSNDETDKNEMTEADMIRVLFSHSKLDNKDSMSSKSSSEEPSTKENLHGKDEIGQSFEDLTQNILNASSNEDCEYDEDYIDKVLASNADQSEIVAFFEKYLNEEDDEGVDSDDCYGFYDAMKKSDKEEKDEKFIDAFRDSCFTAAGPLPHYVVQKQLDVLNKFTDTVFPKDSRTFLKTPRSTKVHSIDSGQYWHNELKSTLMLIARSYIDKQIEERCIKLLVNIDGAPLAKSTEKGLWIISCSETILKNVDVIGIYHGPDKPKDSDDLLNMFVDELTKLINDGVNVDGQNFSVILHALICDTPAKAYVLKVKYHSGYWSCTKCKKKGSYAGKVIFCGKKLADNSIETKVDPLRTDEGFKNFAYMDNNIDEGYQQGKTILTRIPNFGCVTNVVIDYMHLICLGITLRLILLWQNGPIPVRLSEAQRNEISLKLSDISCFMPSDFSRKPRQFQNVQRIWKAHELRQFLLYTGPVVLRDILDDNAYKNFLTLHVSITIAANPILCKFEEFLQLADELTQDFFEEYQKLYGETNVTHNVHMLLHLIDDVRKFGAVDSFSAFRFENHIGKIKRLVKKGDKPLQQIARRTAEIKALKESSIKDFIKTSKFVLSRNHTDGPLFSFPPNVKQFKLLEKDCLTIDSKNVKNNCVLLKEGHYVECCNFIEDSNGRQYIIGQEMKPIESFYTTPIDSGLLNIKWARPPCKNYSIFYCESIVAKVCKVLHKKCFVLFPLIHTYEEL